MKFYRYIVCAFLFIGAAIAETININWINDGKTYAQTTCEIGGDIILPEPPTKRGHTFVGWQKEYTRLEYIESTGIQWFDTGISVGLTDLLYTDTKYSYTRVSSESYLLGTNSNLSQNRLTLVACYQTKHLFGFGEWSQGNDTISEDTIYKAETLTTNGSQTFTYNNVSYNKTWTQTKPFLSNLLLFPTLSIGQNFRASAKVYYLIVKKNNSLVRNFIPAKRNSDSAIGMYDTVTQKFFTNQGTGKFIAGPVAENQNFDE